MRRGKWTFALATTLMLATTSAAALSWATFHTMKDGNMRGSRTIATADGGFLISGTAFYDYPANDFSWDHYLAKYDADGALQGDRLLSDRPAVSVHEIRFFGVTLGYYLLSKGRATHCQNNICEQTLSVTLTHIDAFGNLVWDKMYSNKKFEFAATDMVVDHQGITIAGTLTSKDDYSKRDLCAMRVDPEGNLVWHNRYDLAGSGYNIALAKLGTRGYVMAGTRYHPETRYANLWVMEIDNKGVIGRQREFDSGGADFANDIVVADATVGAEQYILIGKTMITQKETGASALAMRFDMVNENPPQWVKLYNGNSAVQSPDEALSATLHEVAPGSTELIMVGGSVVAAHGSMDGFAMRLDPTDGEIEWHKYWGGVENEWLYDVQPAPDGNYFVTGVTFDGATPGDQLLWAMAISPQGLPYLTEYCWAVESKMEATTATMTSAEPTIDWYPLSLKVEVGEPKIIDPEAVVFPMCDSPSPLP